MATPDMVTAVTQPEHQIHENSEFLKDPKVPAAQLVSKKPTSTECQRKPILLQQFSKSSILTFFSHYSEDLNVNILNRDLYFYKTRSPPQNTLKSSNLNFDTHPDSEPGSIKDRSGSENRTKNREQRLSGSSPSLVTKHTFDQRSKLQIRVLYFQFTNL